MGDWISSTIRFCVGAHWRHHYYSPSASARSEYNQLNEDTDYPRSGSITIADFGRFHITRKYIQTDLTFLVVCGRKTPKSAKTKSVSLYVYIPPSEKSEVM